MSDFYVILTDAGQALMAAATAGGAPVALSQFGVDDGNGAAITPDPAQTTLVNEVYRGDISILSATGNTIKAQLVIPKDSGGYTIQGFGLYTDDGTLFSICNFPAQEKPLPSSGYAVKMDTDYYLQVSDTSVVTLQFDGDDYLTREQADTIYLQIGNNLSEIAAAGAAAQQAARDNIDLGSAATLDAQTSKDDVTPGRVLVNGSAIAVRSFRASGDAGGDTTDANNLPANSVSFVYSSATNSPDFEASVLDFGGLDGTYNTQLAASYSTPGLIKFRAKNGDNDTWNVWHSFYTTGNKPTAADTGALPVDGTAAAATKLATARNINGVPFDGTVDITISASAVGSYTKEESDGKYQLKNASGNATNGWFKDSSTGVITQWGMTTSVSASQPINFPIAFPSVCVGIQVTAFTNGVAGTMETGCSAYSNTAATLTANQPFSLFWVATGY
ncbi:Uncharacterised protein [Buttiauxella agrestis]|uniref:Phage tail fibre repeat n=1 Tax=Buttiauxella agrestis TaxID=82977 RepID=A0A381C7I1_9ENTR|nr:phage tail protein [Buttiauxella agrestis]SUW63299.1 Uncharacterised protein [Buttiauxella agrestis]